jgi:hypothetical protein
LWLANEQEEMQAKKKPASALRAEGAFEGVKLKRLVDAAGAGFVKVIGNILERRAGVLANGLNCRQADDHDQRQHNRVFNSRGAVFRFQKALDFQSKIFHVFLRQEQKRINASCEAGAKHAPDSNQKPMGPLSSLRLQCRPARVQRFPTRRLCSITGTPPSCRLTENPVLVSANQGLHRSAEQEIPYSTETYDTLATCQTLRAEEKRNIFQNPQARGIGS